MFYFKRSQMFRKWFLYTSRKFFSKGPIAKTTSKYDVRKILLSLNLAAKRDAFYKNKRASKVSIYLQDK